MPAGKKKTKHPASKQLHFPPPTKMLPVCVSASTIKDYRYTIIFSHHPHKPEDPKGPSLNGAWLRASLQYL